MISKKLLLTIVFGTLIIASASLYIIADSDLYYYGKNNLPIYNRLPFEMKPEYWNTRQGRPGFKIMDKYDFSFIDKDIIFFKYPNIKIDSLISYGFNDTIFIALIKAHNINFNSSNLYCLKQYNIDSFNIIPYTDCNIGKIKHDYNIKWIENPNNPPYLIMAKRSRSAFIFYISLIFFIIYFRKYLKEKHKEKK